MSRPLRAADSYRGMTSWLLLVLLFLYGPIMVLVAYSFNASSLIVIWQGFSLHWYAVTLQDPNVRQAIMNSLIVAVCATAIAVPIATLGAMVIVRKGGKTGRLSQAGLVMPLMVPEIVLAIATLLLFSVLNIHAGLLNLILAHTAFCTPFAFLPIRAAVVGLDETLDHAARDLYSTPAQTFRQITVPLLMPGIVAGAMLSLVMSIDDFVTSYMLSNAGSTTVPVYIFSMIRQGVTPQINALSSLLLLLSFLLIGLFGFLNRRK